LFFPFNIAVKKKEQSFDCKSSTPFPRKAEGGRKLSSKFVHRPQDSLPQHIGCVSRLAQFFCVLREGVPVCVVDVQPGATKKQ